MLIRNAEVEGRRVDVRLAGDRIGEVAAGLGPRPGEEVRDAAGGALLPGLHDHHIHLASLAAALASVRCGPPDVRDAAALARALRQAPGDGWIRGVGYHESVAGELDRGDLDAWVPERPLRLQHRSGALWMLNGAACRALGIDGDGRVFRDDERLRRRRGDETRPDLAPLAARLARLGVSGVTDATARNGPAEEAAFAALPQRVLAMGGPGLRGPCKLMLHEDGLPAFDHLADTVRRAHDDGRTVAVHCATRSELVFALEVLAKARVRAGDRIEHASVAPPEAVARLAELGLTVVTQPNFLAERGDAYLGDVEPRDRPWLYRGRAFLAAGVPLAGGTDAPFGAPDPWAAMRAAVERRSTGGRVLGETERLTPEEALALFTGAADAPGGPPRRVAAGERADLCLLERPWHEARERLRAEDVRGCWIAGVRVSPTRPDA